jgi:hypothetical protein
MRNARMYSRRSRCKRPPCSLVYKIPAELETFEEYERRHHLDLARLDDRGVSRELQKVRHALLFDDVGPERGWLDAREAAVRGELLARARSRRTAAERRITGLI